MTPDITDTAQGRIAVTGSIAEDYLMSFPGSFSELIMPEEIADLALSFLIDAMLRHHADALDAGVPVVADPSQQLARLEPDQIRQLVDGATYLMSNAYEAALITRQTGWSEDDVLETVGPRGYLLDHADAISRFAEAYGDDAAAEVDDLLAKTNLIEPPAEYLVS